MMRWFKHKSRDERGLICPKCECRHFHVVYTRPLLDGRIKRRKECRNCGKRLTSYEKITPVYPPDES